MSLELWKSIFDWSAVVLVGLSIIAGSLALITGAKINDLQTAQLEHFKIDIAKQQERAANAEKETAQLKILARGREITPEQSRQIAASLVRFKGAHVFVSSYVGDAEAARLGLQIKAALQGAGIQVDDTMGSTFAASNNAGSISFGIGVSALPQQQNLGTAIAKALREDAQLEAKAYVVSSMLTGRPDVGIMVGSRPLPKIE